MYKILKATQLNAAVYEMVIEAPNVAKRCQPGQFLITKIDEEGERIPLTICDYDREKGTVDIVFQAVGASTERMSALKTGDYFQDVVGPLGQPSDLIGMDIEELKKMRILFVGGGVGIAPIYPQVKWLHKRGIKADVVVGARSKDILILEDKLRAVSDNLYITTDDGSYVRKGLVTNVIDDLIAEGKKYDRCVCIGPMIMMKFACLTTKKYNIPTVASLNPIMVDGTGMCGACRVKIGDEVKFACVDGPEFDGHKIDFDAAMKRSQMYKTQEGRAMLKIKEGDTHRPPNHNHE